MSDRSRPSDGGRRALGAEGEERAATWLAARGWRVLARNVRADRVELDVIALRGRQLAFIEVKTRRSQAAGTPEESVDARKRARLVRGARAWLAAHGQPGWCVRFDVIACEPGPSPADAWTIRHVEEAFDASD